VTHTAARESMTVVPGRESVIAPGARCPWRIENHWSVPGVPIRWAEANRLMCDLIHRGRLPDTVTRLRERQDRANANAPNVAGRLNA
jgi:hypothetical protein